MKRFSLILISLVITVSAMAQVRIAAPNIEMVLQAEVGGGVQILYFGERLSDADLANLGASGVPNHNAYPAYGLWCASEASLGVTHSDGNMSTSLRVESVSSSDEPFSQVTRIRMKDTVYPFYVTVCYRAYKDVDMIETWTEIQNLEKKPVVLTRFDSGYLPIRQSCLESPLFQQEIKDDENLQIIIENIRYCSLIPFYPEYAETMEIISDEIQRCILEENYMPEEAIQSIAADVENLLSNYRRK